jgi:hypothetical protein
MSRLFVFVIFGFLLQLSHQLPVKEAASTEKDPNAHGEDKDSPTHNLENIIGMFYNSSSNFHHQFFCLTSRSFYVKENLRSELEADSL